VVVEESSEEEEEYDECFNTFSGGYHFSGEPEKIFIKFFGTNDPFSIINDRSKENLKEILGHTFNESRFVG